MEKKNSAMASVYADISLARYGSFFAASKKNYGETVCAGRRTRMQYLRKHKLGKFAKKH